MPEISSFLVVVLLLMGALAGTLGALLGLGGGVFLVPFLVLVLGLPMHLAVGISLTTVIATSSVVSAGRVGRQLINLRLGMLLEVATAAGGLTGGVVVWMLSPQVLQRIFGIVTAGAALVMFGRLDRRNVVLDPDADPGRLERLLGRVLRADALTSTALLAAGLSLSLAAPASPLSARLTSAGLVILIATPVARVFVSVVDYAAQRDWPFVLLTATVLAILFSSLLVALAG